MLLCVETTSVEESAPGRERLRDVASPSSPTLSMEDEISTPPVLATGRYTLIGMAVLFVVESLTSDPEGLPGLKHIPAGSAPALTDLLSGGVFEVEDEDEYFLFKVEFQWFLTALSVLPESSLAMVAHLFPNLA